MGATKEEVLRRRAMLDVIINLADELGFLSQYRYCEEPFSDEFKEDEREIYEIGIGRFKQKDPSMADFCSQEEVIATIHKVTKDVSRYAEELYSSEMGPIEWALYKDRDRD